MIFFDYEFQLKSSSNNLENKEGSACGANFEEDAAEEALGNAMEVYITIRAPAAVLALPLNMYNPHVSTRSQSIGDCLNKDRERDRVSGSTVTGNSRFNFSGVSLDLQGERYTSSSGTSHRIFSASKAIGDVSPFMHGGSLYRSTVVSYLEIGA